MTPTRLDGGVGTTLFAAGLPTGTSAGAWATRHEAAVAAAHLAFRDAGAEIACTATLRAVPGGDDDPDAVVATAVRAARASGAAVWGSLGPIGPDRGDRGWAEAAARLVDHGVHDVVLETFVDPEELIAAARSVRVAGVRRVVACVVPGVEGRSWRGVSLDVALAPLRGDVDGVGVNCATPAACSAALDALVCLERPIWCKPSRDPGDPTWAAAVARLAARCAWLGGCCGADPASIRQLGDLLP